MEREAEDIKLGYFRPSSPLYTLLAKSAGQTLINCHNNNVEFICSSTTIIF